MTTVLPTDAWSRYEKDFGVGPANALVLYNYCKQNLKINDIKFSQVRQIFKEHQKMLKRTIALRKPSLLKAYKSSPSLHMSENNPTGLGLLNDSNSHGVSGHVTPVSDVNSNNNEDNDDNDNNNDQPTEMKKNKSLEQRILTEKANNKKPNELNWNYREHDVSPNDHHSNHVSGIKIYHTPPPSALLIASAHNNGNVGSNLVESRRDRELPVNVTNLNTSVSGAVSHINNNVIDNETSENNTNDVTGTNVCPPSLSPLHLSRPVITHVYKTDRMYSQSKNQRTELLGGYETKEEAKISTSSGSGHANSRLGRLGLHQRVNNNLLVPAKPSLRSKSSCKKKRTKVFCQRWTK